MENTNKIVKHAGGRPTVMDNLSIKKLEEVFAIGGTDEEACFFANISMATLYNYQKKHPEFLERKEALKQRPILKARTTVVASLDDPIIAMRYLEKKKRDEFGLNIDIRDTSQEEEADTAITKLNKLLQYARNSRNDTTTDTSA